jgi:hypothetical protein
MTCNGDLSGIVGFHDVVISNLLGSRGLQVTVSGRIDPLTHWVGTQTCDIHIRGLFAYSYSTLYLLYSPKVYFDVLRHGPCMDEGTLKTPIPKCRLYCSFLLWVV